MSLAQEALDKAEELDGYREACAACPLNAEARSKQIYAPYFLDKKSLEKLYSRMFTIPLISTMDVVVLHPSADNGYPHTRPNALICVPANVVATSDDSLANTLLHEAIHVHQRRHPQLWATACSREGWTPVSTDQIPEEFLRRCRLNPDTFSEQRFWAWEKYNVPLPLFVREDYPTMEGIQIKWLDLRNNTVFTDPPSSFKKRYGTPPQPEHPFELLAVEYAAQKLQTEELLLRKLQSI